MVCLRVYFVSGSRKLGFALLGVRKIAMDIQPVTPLFFHDDSFATPLGHLLFFAKVTGMA